MLHIAPGCFYGGCLHGHLLCKACCLTQALLQALQTFDLAIFRRQGTLPES